MRQLACYIWINIFYRLLSSTKRNFLKMAMPIKLTFGRWKPEIVTVRCSEQLGNNAGSCTEGMQKMCASLLWRRVPLSWWLLQTLLTAKLLAGKSMIPLLRLWLQLVRTESHCCTELFCRYLCWWKMVLRWLPLFPVLSKCVKWWEHYVQCQNI